MKGADRYYDLFPEIEQFGKLCVVPGNHARGKTFCIFVLPENYVLPQGQVPWRCIDAVEVYGIVCGNPGWTEEYGWLHEGKWQDDFRQIVEKRKVEKEKAEKEQENLKQKRFQKEESRITRLLKSY